LDFNRKDHKGLREGRKGILLEKFQFPAGRKEGWRVRL
jgi:hypothetical protein